MDLQTNDRVMEPTGHAATVVGIMPADVAPDRTRPALVTVTRDADGESRQYESEVLTKLATRESAIATRGATAGPRAWTMGGRVD